MTDILRTINTAQERKVSFAHPEFVRAKRNHRNIPDSWYDIMRSNATNRSWKNNRVRKQWMRK